MLALWLVDNEKRQPLHGNAVVAAVGGGRTLVELDSGERCGSQN
jgi:glutamate synthase domain-containing protein 3